MKIPRLEKKDTIAIVAPAKPFDKDALQRCKQAFEERGFEVYVPKNENASLGYLAGSDEERAESFMEAWLHPKVKALWCYSGGYGSTRILHLLDYEAIKKNPKIFIGMSDITALHAALQKKCQIPTFLGPNLYRFFGMEKNDGRAYTEEVFWNVMTGKASYTYRYPSAFTERFGEAKVLSEGISKGKAVGGNLAMIVSLIGTPYEMKMKGKILFLEDVNEQPYRVDRMLQQLKQTKQLDHLAGVVLCAWPNCVSKKPEESLTLEQVFRYYFEKAPYPVLMNFPSGHITHQATVPLYQVVKLDTYKKEVSLV